MPDLINIGTGALLAFQSAITTTGNNISNLNTEGYSRQTVNFETLPSSLQGFGNGVSVQGIERVYNEFLVSDLLTRSSGFGSADIYNDFASQVDSLFADSDIGLQNALDSFYSAIQDVANNPSSLPERQALLGQAEQLVAQVQQLDDSLDAINQQVRLQTQETVAEINSLTEQIATVNEEIVSQRASRDVAPNDLLDKRDLLVKDLAGLMAIRTIEQSDGALNISLANGASLVSSSLSSPLETFQNEYDASKLDISFSGVANSTDISHLITGGTLGGVIKFRDDVLDPARSQLGLIAASTAQTFNEQHQLGIDLEGAQGGDFFTTPNTGAVASINNSGSATVSVDITDIQQLTADSYELSFNGTDWTLTNLTEGSSQTGAGPFNLNGIAISTSGVPTTGDGFLIRPTLDSADQFDLVFSDPRAFAAASPLRASQPLSNSGDASLSNISVADSAAIPLASAVTLTFNPDALGAGVPGFDVTGIAGGPIAYDPSTESSGTTITLGDLSFEISGTPVAGDTLDILNNTGAVGDNSNALTLAGLQSNRVLLNGTTSLQELHSTLVADVGTKASTAQARLATESTLLSQAEQSVASVSGVNLDEEAAALIQYQQAYQAAAQIISMAQTLFDTLLSATRR